MFVIGGMACWLRLVRRVLRLDWSTDNCNDGAVEGEEEDADAEGCCQDDKAGF